MCGGPMTSKSDNEWRAEEDHRTLSRAAEVQADKSRMAGVKKHHKKVTKQHSMVGRALMAKR